MFSVFKQYYTYFHTFFHPHIKIKNSCLNTHTKQALKIPDIEYNFLGTHKTKVIGKLDNLVNAHKFLFQVGI